MTTSSARPDALDEAARGLTVGGNRLHEAARAVWSAAEAYRSACADRPLASRSSSAAGGVLAENRALVSDLARVADAFRSADSGYAVTGAAGGLARTTDVTLSNLIAGRHPGLGLELTGPTRDMVLRGRALAGQMVEAMTEGGARAASERLASADPADLADPIFAAAVANALGPDRVRAMVDELAFTAFDWSRRFGPLDTLASTWARATRTLDTAPGAPRLDRSIVEQLLASAGGRNVLRALAGSTDEPVGRTYLDLVHHDLLVLPGERDASLSAAYHLLTGAGREGDPDAAMVHAVGLVPGAALDVLLGDGIAATGGGTPVERVQALLSMGPGTLLAPATFLAGVLADPRIADGPDGDVRTRADILRTVYTWVLEDPDRVTEPFAQFLAGTVASDIDFYTGRVDTAPGGELTSFFTAITGFDRPWMTALLAFQHHGVRAVQDTLHSLFEVRAVALTAIGRLETAFERAAADTDRALPAAGFFPLLGQMARLIQQGSKLAPVAGMVVGTVVDRALKAIEAGAVPEGDDHEARTRLAREGLRRRIWVVIAHDQRFGPQLDWAVGGSGPAADGVLGSRITGVDDLLEMTGSEADLDELRGWSEHQPEELRNLVEAYLSGVD